MLVRLAALLRGGVVRLKVELPKVVSLYRSLRAPYSADSVVEFPSSLFSNKFVVVDEVVELFVSVFLFSKYVRMDFTLLILVSCFFLFLF